jgi:hypothetical protein
MAQLSIYNHQLFITRGDQLLIASLDGTIQSTVEMLGEPIRAAAPLGDEVALALKSRIIITEKRRSQWRELMKGFGAIGDVITQNDDLVIADAQRHRLIGFDAREERPYKLAGSGEAAITDGPAKEAGLDAVSRLGVYGESLYFLDARIGQLRLLKGDAVQTCEQGGFEGAQDLACGQMDGACGGFRIFILREGEILAYDPIDQSQSVVCEAPQGAQAIALEGCALYVLSTGGVERLDLKEMRYEPIELKNGPDMHRAGPATEMNEEE